MDYYLTVNICTSTKRIGGFNGGGTCTPSLHTTFSQVHFREKLAPGVGVPPLRNPGSIPENLDYYKTPSKKKIAFPFGIVQCDWTLSNIFCNDSFFFSTQNEMEELETLQEDAMSQDAESQDETQSFPGVSPQNEGKSISADATDRSFPKARRKRTPVRKNSKEDKMKSIRNFQRSNSQSKNTKEDTRKSHDLKQKVRKVRFFLPFSASLETKQKVYKARKGDRNLTIDKDDDTNVDTMTALLTQLKRLRTTQIYNESLDNYSKNETGTIEEESVVTGSYIDGSKGGWAGVAGTEEGDDRSRIGSVSGSSVTSSRNSNRKSTAKVSASSGDEAKVRWSLLNR